ncbi:hypothetical protein [Caulobacter soli]|uniref:hypothetical protein n=1 Tax=Caulobacter soli TaxID=2708539 RepID=UPI0013EB66AC|nr:hypothetical protein [Caulobacter soli]
MAERAPAPVIDLLAWPAIAAARAERDAAEAAVVEAAVVEAKRRWLLSPHGKIRERLSALQEATHRLLKAGQALAELTGEVIH